MCDSFPTSTNSIVIYRLCLKGVLIFLYKIPRLWANLERKDQKDGAHDNLIMTSGSKFGMPAFQVADQVISKPCSWHHAGTAILMFTPSLLTQLTG